VPSPVPTSDVDFCTMDTATDLESQQDLALKLDSLPCLNRRFSSCWLERLVLLALQLGGEVPAGGHAPGEVNLTTRSFTAVVYRGRHLE